MVSAIQSNLGNVSIEQLVTYQLPAQVADVCSAEFSEPSSPGCNADAYGVQGQGKDP